MTDRADAPRLAEKGSLEQAVAQWLAKFPHGYGCTGVIACICDREQRIAARVADAIEALKQEYRKLLAAAPDASGVRDVLTGSGIDSVALRALTQQETP